MNRHAADNQQPHVEIKMKLNLHSEPANRERLMIQLSEFSYAAYAVRIKQDFRCASHMEVSEIKLRKLWPPLILQTLARAAQAFVRNWPRAIPTAYQLQVCDPAIYKTAPTIASRKPIL